MIYDNFKLTMISHVSFFANALVLPVCVFAGWTGKRAAGVCASGRDPILLGAEVDGCSLRPSHSAGLHHIPSRHLKNV